MSEFKAALGAFFIGEIEFPALQRALADELSANPEVGPGLMSDLDRLHKLGRLPVAIHAALRTQIEATIGHAGPPPEPAAPPPAAPPPADDATRIQAPRPRQAGPPPAPPPGDDRTQLGGRPHSRAPDATVMGPGSVRPGAGDEPPTQPRTGTAAGRTGTTGHTGAPTSGVPSSGFATAGSSGWQNADAWSAQDSEVLRPGSIVKQRFVLEDILGAGGMGTVFRARDMRYEEAEDRNPFVALKVLGEEFKRHPKSLVALHREARKSQSLAHPNIVTVYDFDRDGSNVYVTMEMLEGLPLNKVISKHKLGGMPKAEALPLIRDMARALSYAHKKNIIHSDFKPGNAFLLHDGSVKVLDFGIARAAPKAGQVEEEKTRFDVREEIGGMTLAYASLEMLEDKDPDPSDDIYALACTAYELLSGRHPYGKLSAAQALEAGLEPKRIKSLSRREWNAIRHGLEFEREKRTPSAEVFLDELLPGKRQTGLLVGAAVAVVVVVSILVGIYVKGVLDDRKVERLQAGLLGSDDAEVGPALVEAATLSEDLSLRVFGPAEVQVAVVDYYRRALHKLVDVGEGQLEFDEAEKLLAEFREAFQFSAFTVPEFEGLIEQSRSEAAIALQDKFNTYLAEGQLLPRGDQEDITDIVPLLAKVDPQFDPGKDEQLLDAYLTSAREAAQGDEASYTLAKELLEQGLRYRANDTRLRNYLDEIVLQEQEQLRLARVEELKAEIAAASASSLDDFRGLIDPMAELARLAPDDASLARQRSTLQRSVDTELGTLVSASDWPGARTVLDSFAPVLDIDYLERARGRVAEAQGELETRAQALFASVREASTAQRFDAADKALSELQSIGAGVDTIRLARDTIAQAFLSASRKARGAQQWDEARAFAAAGLERAPSMAVESSLRAELDQFIPADQEAEQRGQLAAVAEQRRQQLDELTGRFDQALLGTDFDVTVARGLQPVLDEIASLDGTHPLLEDGAQRIGERLAQEARALGRNNQWDAAVALAQDSLTIVPQSETLRDALTELEQGRQQSVALARAQGIEQRKTDLEALVARAAVTDPAWADQVDRAMQALQGDLEDQAFLARLRSQVAGDLLSSATALRLDGKLPEAKVALERANRFDAQLAGIGIERSAVADAEAALEQQSAERLLAAELDKRKRNVIRLAGALQVTNAKRELEGLSDQLGASDAFLTTEVPEAFAKAYLRLAGNSARENEFAKAIAFVDEGLNWRPGNAELLAAREQYQRGGSLENLESTLAAADGLNVAEVRGALDAVRADGPLSAEWERRLVSAAVAGLRAQATTDRAGAVARQQEILRQLFPGNAAISGVDLAPQVDYQAMIAGVATALAAPRGLNVKAIESDVGELRSSGAVGSDVEARLIAAAAAGIEEQAKSDPDGATLRRDLLVQTVFPGSEVLLAIVIEPLAPPPVALPEDPCPPNLAGYGRRSSGICQDVVGTWQGPKLVVVPGGEMSIFAVTKYEISIGDYNAYCQLSGQCAQLGGDASLPVTGIALDDARRYAAWLSQETGFAYRIPTKQEWLYAASAGSRQSGGGNYNCELRIGGKKIKGLGLESVNSPYDQNGWGLQQHVGNAQEWVDASGLIEAVGGAYSDNTATCDITLARPHDGAPDDKTGFRLVRELPRG